MMHKKFYWMRKSGFTLVEVILALAIIGIISVAIIHALTGGVTNVFVMGSRTKALSEARTIVDQITSQKDTSDIFIQSIIPAATYEKVNNCNDIDNEYNGYRIRYCVKEQDFIINTQTYTHSIVTVVVFYNEKNYVSLVASFSEE